MTRRPLRGLATTLAGRLGPLAGRLGPLAGRLGPLTGRRAGRWRGRSLRSRLVAAAALSVGIVLLGVVGLGYLVVRHELQGQLDRQLHAQADRLGRVWSIAAPAELPPPLFRRFGELNGYTQFLPATGAPLTPPGQAPLPVNEMDRAVAAGAHPAVIEDVPVAGAAVRMLTQPIDGGAVQVALPRGAVDDQLRRLAVAFGVLGAAGLAAAVGLAALVSRPVLAPVGELTEAAERIAATRDLALRIADDRRDELGRLAASFNSMLSALENSARAQHQLVADASHELRTPLASLRTNVEVLHRLDELPDASRDQVLTGIVGQLEELTALVGDLVELARGEERPRRLIEVPFDRIVTAAVARAARHWPATRFDASTEPVLVCGEPARLDRAVANLLDNAAKFAGSNGAPGTVQVRLTAGGVLTVRDHGRASRRTRCRTSSTGSTGPTRRARCPGPASGWPSSSRSRTATAAGSRWPTQQAAGRWPACGCRRWRPTPSSARTRPDRPSFPPVLTARPARWPCVRPKRGAPGIWRGRHLAPGS